MYIIRTHNFLSPLMLRKKLFLETPPFVDATEIYKVYRKINTAHYSYVSISHADETIPPASEFKDCFENIREINGTHHSTRKKNHLYVINPYFLGTKHFDNYIHMWDESAGHMENQPGFIQARLFKTMNNRNKIKLVSIAEWESEETFLSKFDSDAFREIISPYENIFAITFNRKMAPLL
ncbi:antibiotic biosynthesis monooxygenase family protein [Enterobacter cancerogenus]|uniref:antibiotic biosynthesis monooxygenase family protein n=1 Tax=Enterobacter cancerogenus TaxID=69218 RepID=UPI003820D831